MLVFVNYFENSLKDIKKQKGTQGQSAREYCMHSEFIHTLIYQNYEYSLNNKQHFNNFIKQLGKKTDLMIFLIIHFDILKYCLMWS